MKLNCDMGESFGSWVKGNDAQVMPFVDMANIACGFHAADPLTMDKTVKLAQASGVSIGAHPGYPDLLGFGRRDLQCSADELRSLLVYQIAALDGICRINGTAIDYVKPHGALYNRMAVDDATLDVVMQAVVDYAPRCPLVVMATPDAERLRERAAARGLTLWFEAFSDRAYDDQGRLASRSLPGAVHADCEAIERQVLQMINEGTVTSLNGVRVPIQADTLCIHGDNPLALQVVQRLRGWVQR
ncbi:5-oxoprolinase subunit PxpA [Marinobacterium rhizophilum]|uniref:5-oxoprolinase subunit PxpA n=1 Tax=Marinobacterium rhizophilum TaxID=420402 RepID=A0ABY5HSS2_9GAMM|nr:5-oxoprolinase subunit PxpA [Marinobacterium rhizophilum]UTW14210.1 5-oxoprolinase subunit PxpA [Marinobacterium rhizophilum]